MHAELNVRFELSIDNDKSLPFAALAEFIPDQDIESTLLEAAVESLDAARVEAICGEKHATDNGSQRFQRAGTDTRQAVTTAGEHEFTLHYLKDTAVDQDTTSYFRLVEDVIYFDGQNRHHRISLLKPSISPPYSRTATLLLTATASSRNRRRTLSIAASEHTAANSPRSSPIGFPAQKPTLSFLMEPNVTVKTTTATTTTCK